MSSSLIPSCRKGALTCLRACLVMVSVISAFGAHAATGPASITASPQSRTVLQGGSTSFLVTADGTTPLSYQWLKNGGIIPGATSASYSLNAVAPSDEGFYTVTVSNALGTAVSTAAELTVDPGITTGTNATTLLTYGASWRYNQSGADLGSQWKESSYNDTGAPWTSGSGLFAVETTAYPEPFRTVLALGSPQVITYYFRTHFTFNGSPADTTLISSNCIDDGVVYYLNGVEVGRLRIGAGQNSQTLAENQGTEGAAEMLDLAAGSLVTGDNVLAAEVHQSGTASTDIVFGMGLAALTSTRGPDNVPPILASVAATATNRVFVTFSERVDAATATNRNNYAINNGVTITAAFFTNDTRTVALVVSPVAETTTYTLTVNNVKDRAVVPNTIAAASQKTFTLVASGFVSQSIGSPNPAGTFTPTANGVDIVVGGTDIGGTTDQFAFNYQTLTSDFDVKVRVSGLTLADAWSKAGLMARESLNGNSTYAAALTSPSGSGTYFSARVTTASAATTAGSFPINYPNTWLRLRRAGNVFTGLASFDGNNWTQLSSATIAMPPAIFVGMAASSHVPGQTVTAQFRDFAPAAGGPIGPIRLEIEPPGPSRRTSPLAITEIMHSPPRPHTNELEFVEIFNSNPFPEEVSGYRLTGEISYTFPEGMNIAGNAYVIVARNPATFQAVYGIPALGPFTNFLAAEGTLRLRNKEDAVMLEIPYSNHNPWPIGTDETGHSLVLTRASYGEEDPKAWSVSAALGGSPGRHDSARIAGLHNVVINEFLANTDPPVEDYVELYNHSNQSIDISGCFLSDSATTNHFIVPPNTTIPARGFALFSQSQLGFGLSSGGETIYFRAPDNRIIDAIEFEAQPNGVSSGRYPDGAREIYPLALRTPNAANGAIRVSDIAINELMYKPISGQSDDEYIELYNRGTAAVNIGGWRFVSGVSYTFPSNTVMAPGAYLVVARNATNLFAKYTNLNTTNTFGNFSGSLANRGERVALAMPDLNVSTNNSGQVRTNTVYVAVDEVTYGTGGNWGVWANEGGSSLELIDPRANHRLAHNWGDSDETAKAPWTQIEYSGVLTNGSENSAFLEGFLMGEGECLLDEVEVSTLGGPNLCTNGTFELGFNGWVARGDHIRTTVDLAGGFEGRAMHLRADARGDSIMNRIRTPFLSALSTTGSGTIRAKVRWLRGWPEIILRTHGNFLECFARMTLPPNLGTPGARNSRAVANNAPAIYEVTHTPILPEANQAVAVTARVADPDGITSLVLKYRLDPSATQLTVPMIDDGTGLDSVAGDGVFTGTIAGQNANILVAFQVIATDTQGSARLFPLQESSYARPFECLVRFGDPVIASSFGTYRQWMTQDNSSDWQNRPALSNERVFETFVYGNFRVVYNTSSKWSGSPYHQFTGAPATTAAHYSIELPRDDIFLGTENLNKIHAPGNGPFDDNTTQREQFCYWMARQLRLPYNYRRFVNMFFNGNRRGGTTSIMEDTQTPGSDVINSLFSEDPDGDLFKLQPWFETDDTTVGSVGFRNVAWCSLNRYLTISNGVFVPHTSRYRHNYLVRAADISANRYDAVFQLIDAANTSTNGWDGFNAAMESVADVEQWMRTFAIHHSVGDWDHFGSRNSQNMYGYKTRSGRWKLMIWDMNIVLGNSGSSGAGANLFEINGQDPIMPRLFTSPKFRRMYLRALKEICTGPWQQSRVDAILDGKHNALVASGITATAPSAAVKPFINSARTAILNTVALEEGASFTLTSANAVNTSSNLVVITGEAPVEVAAIRINGQIYPINWTRVRNWEVRVVVTQPNTALSIQALDLTGKVIGATLSVTVDYSGSVLPPEGQLVISEVMYNPASSESSFIEIYNRAPGHAFDLTGWRLNGVDYTFPGTIIGGGQYVVLVKNGPAFAAAFPGVPFTAQFEGNLDNGGETLSLERPTLVGTNTVYVAVDKLRYDDDLPWPGDAAGFGPSIQLIDSAQDNSRVSNWTDQQVWRQIKITGNMGGSTNNLRLFIFLDAPGGEITVDDFWLVEGTTAESGVNLIRNGNFESPLSSAWIVSTNNTPSAIINTRAHSGASSLRFVSLTTGSASTTRSVYQDVIGANTNTIYTLSFWYLPSTQGNNLTVRTAPGSFLNTTTSIKPVLATPGAANSVAGTLPPYDPVWLNEVQTANVTGLADNNGEREPWIELYNSGDAAVDLSGYFLATNYTNNLTQWAFPAGTTIAPKSFRILWADAQPGQTAGANLHTSFRLPGNGGQLALVRHVNNVPQITDYLNYPALGADLTYGSAPDGQPFQRVVMFNPTPGGTNIARNVNVFINEWMASNTNTLTDPADGTFDDWFELYNAGDAPVDLGGYFLTDNLGNRDQYMIPTNGQYVIPAGGYLLVWADNDSNQNSPLLPDLHADFQLGRTGESIGLFSPDGQTPIDTVTFGEQTNNISQGRFADGANSFYFMTTPTPRGPNTIGGGNLAPILNPIANYTIILGQSVAFTAVATDSDQPPQPLTYSLDAGAPGGATIGSATGQFTWTPSPSQAPSTNAITVRVTDNGAPPRSATRTFTIFVRGSQIAIGKTGSNQISISFDAVSGRTYRVEYKNNLTDTIWTPLQPAGAAAGSTVTVQDNLGAGGQRFYRIVQLD